MIDVNGFYRELDALYQRHNNQATEQFLTDAFHSLLEEEVCGDRKEEAIKRSDARIAVLNETACFYRGINHWEKCRDAFRQLLEELDARGLRNGENYGVVLVNLGTAYRMMGQHEAAERAFSQAEKVLQDCACTNAYILASLCNNRALLYLSSGNRESALENLYQAKDFLDKTADTQREQATTLSNIASACIALGRLEEGERAADQSIALFQRLGGDPHYGSALNSKAQFCCRRGEYEQAARLFEEAAENTKLFFGENQAYAICIKNGRWARAQAGQNRPE